MTMFSFDTPKLLWKYLSIENYLFLILLQYVIELSILQTKRKYMWDFLTFNTFIAQNVLMFFYYLGAIGVPILMIYYRKTLLSKFLFLEKIELYFQDKTKTLVVFVIIFLLMELFWRMIFEMMIGYFDMHDYLYHISQQIKN